MPQIKGRLNILKRHNTLEKCTLDNTLWKTHFGKNTLWKTYTLEKAHFGQTHFEKVHMI